MTSLILKKIETALGRISNSKAFSRLSISAILFSAMLLGFETNRALYDMHASYFKFLDGCVLLFFTIEIAIRFASTLTRPSTYFKDGWNVFDLAIITACYLPSGGQFASVARLIRVLRMLRLMTHVPRLKLIVETMLRSLSSMGYISLLLGLVFYVYGIIGVFSFGSAAPTHFDSLGTAFLTLFQIVTLEGWVEIMNSVSPKYPLAAPVYFISFIVLGTMIALNLFIGVIVNSLSEAQTQMDKEN